MKTLQVKHPYRCETGNYFQNGLHHRLDSWASFLERFDGSDRQLNLVWRWDWMAPEPDDEEPAHRLFIYMIKQRKAFQESYEIRVTPADEPAIRAFLELAWLEIQAMWAPFSGVIAP